MLLDADVIIDFYKGQSNALDWFNTLNEIPSLSGIAVLEVLFGSRDKQELARIKKFLNQFVVIWPSKDDMIAASGMAPLHLSHALGLQDALIAATCIRLGEIIVTLNLKHFKAVPGLSILKPYTK